MVAYGLGKEGQAVSRPKIHLAESADPLTEGQWVNAICHGEVKKMVVVFLWDEITVGFKASMGLSESIMMIPGMCRK